MNQSLKTVLAAVAFLTAVLLLLWAVDREVVKPAFERLARIQAEEDAARGRGAVQREIKGIKRQAADWANWDDAYEFAFSRDEAFLQANLPDLALLEKNTSINLCFIFDRSGKVLFGGVYDTELGGELSLAAFAGPPSSILAILQPAFKYERTVEGILATEHGLLLVSAQPIRTSLEKGPSRGVLVFGRFLDRSLVGEMRERIRVEFDAFSASDRRLAEEEKRILLDSPSSPEFRLGPFGKLYLYEILLGLDGRPAVLLRTPVRGEFALTAYVTRWLLVRVLGVALLFALAIWIYLRMRPRPEKVVALSASVWAGIALVVLIGLALMLGLFLEMRRRDQERLKGRFQRFAEERSKMIIDELAEHLHELDSIRRLYSSSQFVERVEFRDFVAPILDSRSFRSLEWLPRVPRERREEFETSAREEGLEGFRFSELDETGSPVRATEREEHYPIYYLEPLKGNETVLGLDRFAIPVFRAAMENAAASALPQAAELFPPVHLDESVQPGIHVFVPFYVSRPEIMTPSERRRNLKGFVAGFIHVGGLTDVAVSLLAPRGLYISLLDLSRPAEDRLIYRHVSRLGSSPMVEVPGLAYLQDFNFAGRLLRIEIAPSRDFLTENRLRFHWWVLVAGLPFVSLLAFLLFSQQHRAAFLQSLLLGRERAELRDALRLRRKMLIPSASVLALALASFGWYSGGNIRVLALATGATAVFLLILWLSAGRAEERLGAAVVNREREYDKRRLAEKAVAESEEKYRKLAEAVEAIPWEYDILSDRWTYVAPQVRRILGWEPEEWTDLKFWVDRIDPEDRNWAARYCSEAIARGESHVFEYRFLKKDGDVIWLRDVGTVETRDGVPVKLRGYMIDITAAKKAEEEKERLREQLFSAQKMESVGRLAGGVAHDFNNMLQAILGHAEMSQIRLNPSSPLHHNLQEIIYAARRSADLTSKLLAFARRQTINPQVLDLNEVVSAAVNLLKRLVGEEIELVWKPVPGLGFVRADRSQIEQVLVNLVINSRDATVGGGVITIRTSSVAVEESVPSQSEAPVPGEYVLLSISDTGSGMDQETLAHIFEPFFTTKDMDRGAGLGLSTVYGIVKQNKGFIEVESALGQGSTFNIYLPRVNDGTVPVSAEPSPGKSFRGTETVLVVEDDESVLNLCVSILERVGYKVLAARLPSEAIASARNHAGDIQLLITDVVMPEMDGKKLAAEVKGIKPEIRCLYMSGYPTDVIVHRNLLEEGIWLIRKPFSIEELSRKVREVLDA